MKEVLKEIIAGNQNRLPAEVKPRAWEVPADTEKQISADGAEISVLPAWKFMLFESVPA
jgi:hypothetical protein